MSNLHKSNIQISIIIPTLNEAANIGRLVHYLRENAGAAVSEILVVDSNSSDGTPQIASNAGARVHICEVCSRAAQMNLGAKTAQNAVLYFVHADTIPPRSFAVDIQREMEAGQLMGCYRYQFDSPKWILKFNAFFVRYPWLWCQGGDKTFFVKQEIFEEFGGYDERFIVMEEYDFLRKAMKKYPLRVLPENVLVSARKYEHNSWLRVQLANIGAFSMFRWGVEPIKIKRFYQSMLSK
ncbi:MAG: TIGR04283 family arsenosugar biosynthesis glycosyltransferase [Saprospiraceae bacterium]|nr:TIGR04283 family arsenosugar biosynthesis glycosyltransferase [Saprospiraceae bacterium]